LYVVPIELPPLRQRGNDVVLIATELLARYAREDGKQLHSFSPEVLALFRAYAWPGNVRELVNVIRAVVALHDGPTVQFAMLPAAVRMHVQEAVAAVPLAQTVEEVPWFAQATGNTQPAALGSQNAAASPPASLAMVDSYDPAMVRPLGDIEREAVDYALRAYGGNVAQAAQALRVNPSTLYRKIQVWATQGSAQLSVGL
jgi:two-component system, repressor protein LuxO